MKRISRCESGSTSGPTSLTICCSRSSRWSSAMASVRISFQSGATFSHHAITSSMYSEYEWSQWMDG